jgi:hypothetical protein
MNLLSTLCSTELPVLCSALACGAAVLRKCSVLDALCGLRSLLHALACTALYCLRF